MSMVPADAPGVVAEYDPDVMGTGLEDFDPTTDGTIPRLGIDHKKSVFVDSLSKEEFGELDLILLTFHKGRILWDDDVQDDATPMCKSYDFHVGIPDLKQFPWRSSGFDEAAFAGQETVVLPCDSCHLKDWGTHPKRDNAPWCGEQHTYPALQNIKTADNPLWVPVLITVQRTSLKNSKNYVQAFHRAESPLFTVVTHLTLRPQKRGNVEWAVVEFRKGQPTDSADWVAYSQKAKALKQFIATPRVRDDDEESQASQPTAVQDPAEAQPTPAPTPQPAPAPAPAPTPAPTEPAPAPAPEAPAAPAPVAEEVPPALQSDVTF